MEGEIAEIYGRTMESQIEKMETRALWGLRFTFFAQTV